MIPYMGTQIYQKYRPSADWEQSTEGLVIYMKENGIEQVVDFDTYAVGVLGALLTPDAHEETIKAMAVILRTYVHYMSENGTMVDSQRLGQPWLSAQERLIKGMDEKKLQKAIKETEDSCILYEDSPILPLFYEASNGKTRNFSDVWSGTVAYLTSVESLWDKSSEDYIQTVHVSKSEWHRAWGEAVSDGGQKEVLQIQIVEKDDAGYVKQIQIGAETYSGEEVRCRLGLPSACFEYEIKNSGIVFTCYGQGHGVGLSIYGANAMAKEGKGWKEIILWYFPGTSV